MPDDLRTRIGKTLHRLYGPSLGAHPDGWEREPGGTREMYLEDADAVIRELGSIPDRTHTDEHGRTWEWCGGQPGTWAWRITRLSDQCGECLRRGDERDGCNCVYPKGHPSR